MLFAALAAATAAAAPQPAELKTFSDWTVGCDNGRACHAVGLVPEEWPDDALTMAVRRGAEAGAPPIVTFEVGDDSKPAVIVADGVRLPARLVPYEGVARVHPGEVGAVVEALKKAGRIALLTADGKSLGHVSLKGATAALLYIDEAQKRVGTVTALVRRGQGTNVPSPPALPMVRAAPAPRGRTVVVPKPRVAALRREAGCKLDEVGGPDYVEMSALDSAATLVLLACGSGAYNVSYVPYVARAGAKRPELKLATFDIAKEWWGEEGRPVLVNAAWDKERRLLTAFSKGRGLGDCGVGQDFAWDGTRFRLVRQIEMGECRGSVDYITTWRAEVRP